ncbi:gamma carbonic anhydrase family protein [Knoellia koreensis]|jgi:carbonic anhydrase/acetyltransferase-like protein (isoleucine patch superfamily)|uniref:Gamma carbonic anhydrase family protein n=1 Tax=Knoellia koreensis TaxID=2730921 RepID=A0A849HJN1_9MICO|nr:gamma carbonic anhydrase family protein [Knoellia sp. DB2414S]NNM47638.1 gamma carbonic anhydrase family protein [Knoellia sp. DB2414S]
MVTIHETASVAPSAVVSGDVVIGAGSRILPLAVIDGERGTVRIGSDVVVMEHAVLRGRANHPLTIGDAVLVGPHTHLNGTTVEDEVFVATGASLFPGSLAGSGAELRIGSVLHVNSRLEPGTVVPIGWVAAGDPAQLFSADRHEELWQVQEPLDFPGTVYGVPRGTPMREVMRRQSEVYAPRGG